MSKLTPPSMKNKTRRKKFFEEHSELPNAKNELERLEKSAQAGILKSAKIKFQHMVLKSKKKHIKTKGAFGRLPDYLIKRVELEVV